MIKIIRKRVIFLIRIVFTVVITPAVFVYTYYGLQYNPHYEDKRVLVSLALAGAVLLSFYLRDLLLLIMNRRELWFIVFVQRKET